ncbi:MAG: bifunctional phosphoserine phosphatase/homoserine phosphotransferase ThrH [Candidatus Auribacterota bacterium]|jgi:phosphoserine/homoserine phosphotransferase|nr:bifunctional phosphoserine phosphatase/homoserine phosphotransferase ThrH [Candidatus Auribacterota bacterium]
MTHKPPVIAMDLEGVLVPEIWIAVAVKTGIDALRLTTRDVSDYDKLMRGRLDILKSHSLTITDIQEVISTLDPLDGAKNYLDRIRKVTQLILLSDTFYEFAYPLMKKLDYPTLFCNSLIIDEHGTITGYQLRKKDGKRTAVKALKECGFRVLAVGDSYNDTTMLGEADAGILFNAPQNVADEFPQFPRLTDFDRLFEAVSDFIVR